MEANNYVIFLSGPMSGLPDMGRAEFEKYEKLLRETVPGSCVLNPAALPQDLPIERCLPITFAMLDQADTVFIIPGWENSTGAKLEHDYALYNGKQIWIGLPA